MIAWNPKPFIFVHIPKCAGTSIETALMPFATPHDDWKQLSDAERLRFWLPGKHGLQHSKLRHFEKDFDLKEYFKFAFVRNPWDRAISQLEYLRNTAKAAMFANKTIKEQLRILCTTKATIWAQDLSACQADYLVDKAEKSCMDFVGRFENLKGDFAEICRKLGFECRIELPHVFRSRRSDHYSKFYDRESIQWVRERFSRDIEMFKYEFEECE